MNTTCDFLDAVKSRLHLPSDYALAPILGVSRSAVSQYRNRKDCFSDAAAIRVAKLLEMDEGFLIACVHAERAKSEPERAAWESIMQRLGGAAALVLLGVTLGGAPAPAEASTGPAADDCVLCKTRRRNRRSVLSPLVERFTGAIRQNFTLHASGITFPASPHL